MTTSDKRGGLEPMGEPVLSTRAEDSDLRFWFLCSELDLQQLILGIVTPEVKASAELLLKPLTRTDAGTTTAVFKTVAGDVA